jgi:cbb3-type cytochrome oxidase subunit 3
MKLSDVVGHSGLALYAEIAMLLFLLAFVAVLVAVFTRSRRELDHAARLPFEEAAAAHDATKEEAP